MRIRPIVGAKRILRIGIACLGDRIDPPERVYLCRFCHEGTCVTCGERKCQADDHEFEEPTATCDACLEEIYGKYDDI